MDIQVGKIIVLVNGKEVDCETKKLPNLCSDFHVDERFKITYNILQKTNKGINIKCIFLPKGEIIPKPCVETGEKLALVSFYMGDIKLSIGTEGDMPGIQYKYFDNGIQVETGPELSKIIFYFAWMKMLDSEKEDLYTWFAADPSFDI